MTVLVTAASGSVGNNCVAALAADGFDTIATSRRPAALTVPPGVRTRRYDADGETDFDELFDGVDDIVLIAPPLDGHVDEKLAPFVAAAARRGVEHLVMVSGSYLSGMTGRTLDQLPVRRLEVLVTKSVVRHTIVRAGFLMDNYVTGFYSDMVAQGVITLATADGKSALISGSDLGAFVAEALAQNLVGEYLVTGPESLDHHEVADLLTTAVGRRITYDPKTLEELKAMYESQGLPPKTIAYGLTLYKAFADNTTAAVTDGFRQATGRDPMTFTEYLQHHVQPTAPTTGKTRP